jgi:hypothetical protein
MKANQQRLTAMLARPDRATFRRLRDPDPIDLGAASPPKARVYSIDAVLDEQHATWAHWW